MVPLTKFSNSQSSTNPQQILNKSSTPGYRETAAALALISAGIFTEISKSCINGDLPSCNFRKELMSLNGTRKIPHNHLASLSYAGWMTKRFLKTKVKPRDVTWLIRQHNLNVGRMVMLLLLYLMLMSTLLLLLLLLLLLSWLMLLHYYLLFISN